MAIDGRSVTLDTSSYKSPPYCCSCGAPQETQLETSHMQQKGNVRTTLRLRFPYCTPCAERSKAFHSKKIFVVLVAFFGAFVTAGLVFSLPILPLAAGLGLAAIVGVGGVAGIAFALDPPPPPAPATARHEAARIVSFNGNVASILFTSPGFAEAFAHANGASLQPKGVSEGFVVAPIVTAAICAPLAGLAAWMIGHPTVYIDNATKEPIAIYVDGKEALELAADSHDSLDLGYGEHELGWSKKGAKSPEGTTKAEVKVGDDHLYNPGKTACYWLVADVYGSASTDGIKDGPQPIAEFYRIDNVDTWFGANPESVEVSNGSSGDTRVALQRSNSCMQFVEHGCSMASRELLVSCQQGARTDTGMSDCFDKAQDACEKDRDAVGKPVAAGAKPAAAKPAGKLAAPATGVVKKK